VITVRRFATTAVLTLAVLLGAAIPASAAFSDSATVTTGVSTLKVAAPTGLQLTDSCTLTTTRTERTVDPLTNSTSVRQTSSTQPTTTVHHDDVTTVSGNTTTTVSRRTTVHVALSWQGSTTRGRTGYAVIATLPDGSSFAMASTASTSMSGAEDARYTSYGIQLSVRTLTSYGWTADSAKTVPLSC
jgi:hypothetical protein